MNSSPGFLYQFDPAACAACGGRCCRGAGGYVWISMTELERLAAAKGMPAALFARQCVRQAQGRLSLQERVINGERLCCLFDPIACRCLVYASRPEQCRSFPFWERFKEGPQEALLECPGVVCNPAGAGQEGKTGGVNKG